MDADLVTLMMRYETAANVLTLLEETGASADVLAEQLAKCRALRAAINGQCPDGSLSPYEFNRPETV